MGALMPYLLDWANLLTRWLHLIAGIAWIGASFYFVMLDSSLRRPCKPADDARGVHGELWAVHGGGFYCSQKFLAGPLGEPLSEDLHWSKWEAYTTWLSGLGMLIIVYWLGAPGTLVDPKIADFGPYTAAVASFAFLAGCWLIYDLLCRTLSRRERWLLPAIALMTLAAVWLAHSLFAARAAYIHVGAMLGTCMAANVFFHIIPGQKRMVAAIRAGQAVDPRPGVVGKQRSVHNTYFTLPVLFVMISNHYPMTFTDARGAWILVAMMLAGVLIRQYFVMRHRHAASPWLLVAGGLLIVGAIVAIAPRPTAPTERVGLTEAQEIVARRCVTCHAPQPVQPGFAQAPKGIFLDSPERVLAQAPAILTTVASGYMPLGNLTGMTDEERRRLLAWARQSQN